MSRNALKIFLTLTMFSLSVICSGQTGFSNYQREVLCDYEKFIKGGEVQEEAIREELFLKMLGALDILGKYRANFLLNGQFIDLFPTAYYHTTMSEMLIIVRDDTYKHPVEKLQQMLAFFDAYHVNRANYSVGASVEEHWKNQFWHASIGSPDCAGIPFVMGKAVDAHVDYDLPRAIKYAFVNRNNQGLLSNDLLEDFNKTDRIFSVTSAKVETDLADAGICSEWRQQIGLTLLGWLFTTDKDVIKMRKDAWNNAFSNNFKPNLGPQPISNHQRLLEIGSSICGPVKSTLFLFDMSGSMANNGNGTIPKIEQSKNACRSTLNSMQSNSLRERKEVAIFGFEGSCVPDPTIKIFGFSDDLVSAEASVMNLRTGGGTPLGNAIRAAECKLANRLTETGEKEGTLILLSDGQGNCGNIRPSGTYQNAPMQKSSYTISSDQCGGTTASGISVKYYTVGFDIPVGSAAERDLQFLAQSTGGKYLNVQTETELTQALKKFNRTYVPKYIPSIEGLPENSINEFDSGVHLILSEDFRAAMEIYETFNEKYKDDCNGVYNLALMQEANDFFIKSISNYKLYLRLCPNTFDKEIVAKRIQNLEVELTRYIEFQKSVVLSDLAFLKLHFEKIQNGQSVVLAEEFKGFLNEKGSYYKDLPDLIGEKDRFFQNMSNDISEAFERCSSLVKRSPNTWDRDAIPIISMTYLNLQDLVGEM